MQSSGTAYSFPERAIHALRGRALRALMLFALLLVVLSKAAGLAYAMLQPPHRYYLPSSDFRGQLP